MNVVTRFAPSPTGLLHIGGARTALFNYLYARHMGGKFLLRIEDTDKKRSTKEAINAILESMRWLGLDYDGDLIFQSARQERHKEIAYAMLKNGHAYRCFASSEEVDALREQARSQGKPMDYTKLWRNRDETEAPFGVEPVIRLKAQNTGATTVHDIVQGDVTTANETLDDMVLLRADGTPTYMLAVVVDDHDMGVTHVIRGDDHLTNTFRQIQIYKAMGWDLPNFAHIPLIHGSDGAKLSKRHGAASTEVFRTQGYLPEALRNYILRLGWSHGDEEIISDENAIRWFDLADINKAAAKFDYAKLDNLNAYYIKTSDNERLFKLIEPMIEQLYPQTKLPDWQFKVKLGMNSLKERVKTLKELAEQALIYVRTHPLQLDEKAKNALVKENILYLQELAPLLENTRWELDEIKSTIKEFTKQKEIGLGKIAPALRIALTGGTVSPAIFEVAEILGQQECILRIHNVIST